jgi:hypothetical protein
MKQPNLIQKLQRWKTSRAELQRQVDTLRTDNERLQQRLAEVRQAKDKAETQAEDRLREKEALRARMGVQKKDMKTNELLVEQLGAKITELRDENERLKVAKKKKHR